MVELHEIEEGVVYQDGQARRLYDPDDRAAMEAVLFQLSGNRYIGPLGNEYRYDPAGHGISVDVTLLGVKIAHCDLTLSEPNCSVGGGIGGCRVREDLHFQLEPPALIKSGEIDMPERVPEEFHIVIPMAE
jgi:hypothetical protein